MENPNYQKMTDQELRDYVRWHPEDDKAFYILMDRNDKKPKTLITTDEQFDYEVLKRINNET